MATGWRNPKHDLHEEAKTVLEQGVALSLALLTMIFLTYKSFDVQAYEGSGQTDVILIEDIPETEQLKKPPPPQRPQIPVAVESDDIPDDVTIMDTEIDLDAPPPPPPPPPGASKRREVSPTFLAWEVAAEVIEPKVQPIYPDIAQKAGVEGMVVLQIVVDEKGNVLDAVVVLASPAGIFEDAALEAIYKWKFTPAMQRDNPIKVKMAQRIIFQLTAGRPPPE